MLENQDDILITLEGDNQELQGGHVYEINGREQVKFQEELDGLEINCLELNNKIKIYIYIYWKKTYVDLIILSGAYHPLNQQKMAVL